MKAQKLFILVILMFSMNALFAAKNNHKYSIMVSSFENRSGWSGNWDLGQAWAAILTDELNQTGRFIVLGEQDMRQAAMNEQQFSESSGSQTKKLPSGMMTSAQLLIKGEISHFQAGTDSGSAGINVGGFDIGIAQNRTEINAVLYIIDTSTGQVVGSKKCYGVSTESGMSLSGYQDGIGGNYSMLKKSNEGKVLESAIKEGVQYLVEKLPSLPWSGKIVSVKGDTAQINRGKRDGVEIGEEFTVGVLDEVRDPDTGELLDQTVQETGKIKVISVKDKISTCKITQGTGIAKDMTVMYKQD